MAAPKLRLPDNRSFGAAKYMAPGMVKSEQFDSKGRTTACVLLTKREF